MFRLEIYNLIRICIFIPSTFCLRRIHDGQEVQTDKRYAVYFIKASTSPMKYEGWTCGGAIVSPEYIVTAAACVEDVQHLYAIAGYKKLVPMEKLDEDECTKTKKKKVILTCIPKAYDLQYNKIEKWTTTDIAVVKVESPFDFTDESYKTACSYIPAAIDINYDLKYQQPGTDAMALGWGHKEKWRKEDDKTSYNTEIINYASTIILDKEECKKAYTTKKENTEFLDVIDTYMICTDGTGNIDERGFVRMASRAELAEGCMNKRHRLRSGQGANCEKDDSEPELMIPRAELEDPNPDSYQEDDNARNEDIELDGNGEIVIINRRNNTMPRSRKSQTRRSAGICQNDHGGPLITWVGAHEVLIGVASVFKVTSDSMCAGPYLFTSTHCNAKFLDCVVNDGGPADNELFDRPQIPLYSYHQTKKKK